jgi:transposase InsO family protein
LIPNATFVSPPTIINRLYRDDDVEYATLGYINWFNHRRLHGEITDDNSYVTPAEFEALYYRQTKAA